MKEQIISFKTSQMIKLVWNDLKESDVSHFYMKPNCGMLGIDEEGRYFIISRSKKGKLYKIGKEVTSSSFSNVFLAPTQSLLQKWLREVHNIHIDIRCNNTSNGKYFFYLHQSKEPFDTLLNNQEYYKYYEEALEVGLFEALKLILDE